jgi:hypothetical protein
MNNKLFFLTFLVALGIFTYFYLSPTINNYSCNVDEMELALEENFKVEINSTNYYYNNWHSRLAFEVNKDSKTLLSEEEARAFLASSFPRFRFVDEFQLD